MTEDPDRQLILPALLGVVAGHVLRHRRHGGTAEAGLLAASLMSARPASRLGGWVADEFDLADSDMLRRAILAFGAGLALVLVTDMARGKVPRWGR